MVFPPVNNVPVLSVLRYRLDRKDSQCQREENSRAERLVLKPGWILLYRHEGGEHHCHPLRHAEGLGPRETCERKERPGQPHSPLSEVWLGGEASPERRENRQRTEEVRTGLGPGGGVGPEPLLSDKDHELLAPHRHLPQQLQVGNIVLQFGFRYSLLHRLKVSLGLLESENYYTYFFFLGEKYIYLR